MSTLIVLTWLLGGAMFWYTDIERSTEQLALDALAIRFEAHVMVAERTCGSTAVALTRPTGTIQCRPLGTGTIEVDVRLQTGERHKEVIYFDD
ncbi:MULTISPECIES: hypothetical protein [Exiguobacterium]|jgi:hypothetical protein|uniref:Uncharacterized protein n=2 Tax=Exiguobacterium TaxID=33986 RepID=U1LI40_9BACL|nr:MULTISPECIES: hypothetical protein [Exiguobacterium]ERG67088.1 hypothetical protein M467_07315 [Exiguobacterium chiriqhucha RW-2]KAB2860299.1 MAG: hypothetical protein F9K39_15695 [Exiguobacterium chiriqhucha]MDL5377338.1 hypothetical protein [Exiguobacterium mexicanum]